MSHDNDEQCLTTILEALKMLRKWSPSVKSIDDAKGYLLEAFPAHDAAHKGKQVELLPEIMRVAGHGQQAAAVELIKRLARP